MAAAWGICAVGALSKTIRLCKNFSVSAANLLPPKVGERLPDISLYEDTPATKVNVGDLFKGKKGILFSVLGAFSPGCSHAHIPEYVDHYDKFKDEGYEVVACVSVNDPFVMSAWGKSTGATGKIRMLADTHRELTRAFDMELDTRKFLGTIRSKRYSLIVEDSVIKQVNLEPDATGLACLLCIRRMSEAQYVPH